MKKLMFAAVVTAGVAMIAGTSIADVTSANVVGYAGNECDTDYGTVLMSPQFANVGSTGGISLSQIKPIADTDYEISSGDVDIQFLDNGGATISDKVFQWNGSKWVYQKTKEDASEFVIPAGQGVQVGCGVDPDDAVISLQGAGEVSKSDALVELDQDYGTVLAGNPFPVGIKLGKFTLEVNEGSDYEISSGDVDIQFLDNGGATISDKVFQWNGSKWVYQKTKEDASEFVIPAGQGIQVGCGVDPDDAIITLRIPAPTF